MVFHMIKGKALLAQSVKLKGIGNLPPSKQGELIVLDFPPTFASGEDAADKFLVIAFGKGERFFDEGLFCNGS